MITAELSAVIFVFIPGLSHENKPNERTSDDIPKMILFRNEVLMKLGISFSGSDPPRCLVAMILDRFTQRDIPIYAYASTGPLFECLLSALLETSPDRLRHTLRRKKLRFLSQLQTPLLFCQKDLLRNRAVYFGNLSSQRFSHYPARYENRYSIRRLLKIAKHSKPFWYRRDLFSNCYLSARDFLMGMRLSGCQTCLMVRISERRQNVGGELSSGATEEFCLLSPYSAQLNIQIDPTMDLSLQLDAYFARNQLNLYEFLYLNETA